MTDYAGNDAQAILYYPWGQVWSNPGGNSLLQVYASLTLYDTVNNGYVPPFRYYVSNQGRWLTPDPLAGDVMNPQSLNRYAYVTNNPTSLTDPLGLGSHRAAALVTASALVVSSWLVASRHELGTRPYIIPVRTSQSSAQLQDISDRGHALFEVVQKERPLYRLVLWDIAGRKIQSTIELPTWGEWVAKKPPGASNLFDSIRFQKNETRIVALQSPWLVLIDPQAKTEVRRILPLESYLNPGLPEPYRRSDDYPSASVMALSPRDDSVAVAFNIGGQTHLFLYDAELRKQNDALPLPRLVSDLCWSPDGTELAILYAARYDESRRPVSVHTAEISPEADVWVLDPATGQPTVKFSTGSSESQIAFNRDGTKIYTINTYLYGAGVDAKGAIRVFAAFSGRLIQTITGPSRGVRNRLAISPDGKLIAADASTYPPIGLHELLAMEQNYSGKISRIVTLDVGSGKVVFEHAERTLSEQLSIPLRFGFSPDGRQLLVDFGRSKTEPYGHTDVFSVGQDP